jgi:hypothetical protein
MKKFFLLSNEEGTMDFMKYIDRFGDKSPIRAVFNECKDKNIDYNSLFA